MNETAADGFGCYNMNYNCGIQMLQMEEPLPESRVVDKKHTIEFKRYRWENKGLIWIMPIDRRHLDLCATYGTPTTRFKSFGWNDHDWIRMLRKEQLQLNFGAANETVVAGSGYCR